MRPKEQVQFTKYRTVQTWIWLFNTEMLFKYIQSDTTVHWKVYGTATHAGVYMGLLSD